MGIEDRCYRVFIKTPKNKYKSAPYNVLEAIKYVADYLDNMNAVECLDRGYFKKTIFMQDNREYTKRYVIEIAIPYTEITIKKEGKGDIDTNLFCKILQVIKETYNERI